MTEGEIHAVSEAIGSLKAEIRGMARSLKHGRALADQRHHENQQQLHTISNDVTELRQVVTPLSAAVGAMQPVVENYKKNKTRLAGALMLASAILTGIGWVVSNVLIKIFSVLWAAFMK